MQQAAADKVDFREMTAALYRVLSVAPAQRDWEALRPLYHPEARLVRTGVDPDGTPFVSVFTLDAYIENIRQLLDGETRFSEVEIAQESVVFGNVARLTSVYGSPGNRRSRRAAAEASTSSRWCVRQGSGAS